MDKLGDGGSGVLGVGVEVGARRARVSEQRNAAGVSHPHRSSEWALIHSISQLIRSDGLSDRAPNNQWLSPLSSRSALPGVSSRLDIEGESPVLGLRFSAIPVLDRDGGFEPIRVARETGFIPGVEGRFGCEARTRFEVDQLVLAVEAKVP